MSPSLPLSGCTSFNSSSPDPLPQHSSESHEPSMEAIVGIIFGILMLAVGLVGLFQGRRRRLKQSAHVQSPNTYIVANRSRQSMR